MYLSTAPQTPVSLFSTDYFMSAPPDASAFSNGTHLDLSLGTDPPDLLDTPGGDSKRWGDAPETPIASRPKRITRSSVGGTKGATTLTLRDQEKVCHKYLLFPSKFTDGSSRHSILTV